MSDSPTISLCMIAKDEESFIGDCISSVLPIINQVVLVDTGSTDKTIEIAKNLGAEVYYQDWQNDFSVARNVSLQYATSDWILVLDSDEVIYSEDLPEIKRMCSESGVVWELTQRHYTNDVRLSDFMPCSGQFPKLEKSFKGYFESGLVRLFPNWEGLHYRAPIHELVEFCLAERPEFKIKKAKPRIHHYGHTKKDDSKKKKGNLYTSLGQSKTTIQPHDWKNFFELAVEHNNNLRYSESAEAFRKAIELNPTYLSSFVNLGYVYCELGQYDEAAQILESALLLDPRAEEAYCNLGVVYLRQDKLDLAEVNLRKAVTLKPFYVNALYNLSIVFIKKNRLTSGYLCLSKILEFIPEDIRSLRSIASLHLESKNYSQALFYITKAFFISPEDEELRVDLMRTVKMQPKTTDTLFAFQSIKNSLNVNQNAETSSAKLSRQLELEIDNITVFLFNS